MQRAEDSSQAGNWMNNYKKCHTPQHTGHVIPPVGPSKVNMQTNYDLAETDCPAVIVTCSLQLRGSLKIPNVLRSLIASISIIVRYIRYNFTGWGGLKNIWKSEGCEGKQLFNIF